MLSKPHGKFWEKIVSRLSDGRAYALAYPRCSLARLRSPADAIAAPSALNLIEKRRYLAQILRANLALRDPKIDGEMLVSHHVDHGRKLPIVSTIRIFDEFVAIKLDTQLATPQAAPALHMNARRRTHWRRGQRDTLTQPNGGSGSFRSVRETNAKRSVS
jgi:hypothetical protein